MGERYKWNAFWVPGVVTIFVYYFIPSSRYLSEVGSVMISTEWMKKLVSQEFVWVTPDYIIAASEYKVMYLINHFVRVLSCSVVSDSATL